MKKLFIVSKTHLDLGFTDYAETIRQKYINQFIPESIALAEKVNKDGQKNFIWTTGSWIIKEALENGTKEQRENLINAIKAGNIVPHALPFTTHTELLDEDTLDYGLTIVDKLDEYRGRKTVAAKMTDVPGHTRSLVHLLHKHGIKLLHIGVNGASAVPEVPPCFVWKSGDSEVVVVYSGDYGGAFKSDIIDEILYFDHTLDNHGAPSPEKVMQKVQSVKKEYPDYEVTAGTLDDFADIIWEQRSKLPVLETEIGDTWIHGSAADPYKSAALREMMSLKLKWLRNGSMQRDTKEYVNFTDNLLCVAEHTCGMDMKTYFADYEHYLKKDFQKARAGDKVKIRRLFSDFPYNFLAWIGKTFGNAKPGSYKVIEKSWAEQREYIDKAVAALSEEHKQEALERLSFIRPTEAESLSGTESAFDTFTCGNWSIELNKNGGIKSLRCGDNTVIRDNDDPILEYRSFSNSDYDFWLHNYTRNLKQTAGWAVGDFARPLLKREEGKYPVGRFDYKVSDSSAEKTEDSAKITVNFECDKKLPEELGAPRLMQIVYILTKAGLRFDVSWFKKDASRLTEAVYLHLYPENGKVTFQKIGEDIDPLTVESKGGRKLHAVQNVHLATDGGDFRIINRHSPVVSLGKGKILEYDNKFEDIKKDGVTFVLGDNVWGTNFPLWYEDNARFTYIITDEPTFEKTEG